MQAMLYEIVFFEKASAPHAALTFNVLQMLGDFRGQWIARGEPVSFHLAFHAEESARFVLSFRGSAGCRLNFSMIGYN
jgi:hypothetical protein